MLGRILKSMKVYFVALDRQDFGHQALGFKAMVGWFALEMEMLELHCTDTVTDVINSEVLLQRQNRAREAGEVLNFRGYWELSD